MVKTMVKRMMLCDHLESLYFPFCFKLDVGCSLFELFVCDLKFKQHLLGI